MMVREHHQQSGHFLEQQQTNTMVMQSEIGCSMLTACASSFEDCLPFWGAATKKRKHESLTINVVILPCWEGVGAG